MDKEPKIISINTIRYRYYDMELEEFVQQALKDKMLVKHEMEEPFAQHTLYQACDNLAFRFRDNRYSILKTDCLRLIEECNKVVDFTFYSADEYLQILGEWGACYPKDIIAHASLLRQVARFFGVQEERQ